MYWDNHYFPFAEKFPKMQSQRTSGQLKRDMDSKVHRDFERDNTGTDREHGVKLQDMEESLSMVQERSLV